MYEMEVGLHGSYIGIHGASIEGDDGSERKWFGRRMV
jgi:hypothetical protein